MPGFAESSRAPIKRPIDVEMVCVAKKQLIARGHRANGVVAQHMGGVENANAWIGRGHRIEIARIECELTLQHRNIDFTSVRDAEPPRIFAKRRPERKRRDVV